MKVKMIMEKYKDLLEYDEYHKCFKYIPGHWKINDAPQELKQYLTKVNCGNYTIVIFNK